MDCMLVLPGDEQADFSHVHQCSPALDRGCADVWDNTGQRRILFRGQNYQHADGVAVIGQLNHLILQSLRGGGHTWWRLGVNSCEGEVTNYLFSS